MRGKILGKSTTLVASKTEAGKNLSLLPWIDGYLSCESQINLAVSSTRLGRAAYVVLRIFK
jgi:hypothetical protein